MPYPPAMDRILLSMENADTQARIEELRSRVDEVDRELIRILNERARIVQEMVEVKAQAGKPLFDPKREEEILRKVAEVNEGLNVCM